MRIAVIGGGPAGMAAAVTAREQGVEEVMILERHSYLGGVLPQCIHNGFGVKIYDRDLTGGEYAWLWKQKTEDAGVEVMLDTTVLSVSHEDKKWGVKCVSAVSGACEIEADALIVATGCRERTLAQLHIPGSRPAGIFTAGSAQLMMNVRNYLPGRSTVILGSGDIGLIMARRMTLEGIKVRLVLGQESTGLARNIVQCIEDYDIPMKYGWTVVSTHGYERLTGVSVAPFGDDGLPDLSRKEYIRCDTLLVAAGLIPELEVCGDLAADPEGCRREGLFICGNAAGVHDLVDNVTWEGMMTGADAAAFLGKSTGAPVDVPEGMASEKSGRHGNMICTVCPQGCVMQVEREPFSISGNRCEKGVAFAKQELEDPRRVLTAVVKAGDSIVPVRTDRGIEKEKISGVMKAVKRIAVCRPVEPGQIVAKNIAGTGADLIATWYA